MPDRNTVRSKDIDGVHIRLALELARVAGLEKGSGRGRGNGADVADEPRNHKADDGILENVSKTVSVSHVTGLVGKHTKDFGTIIVTDALVMLSHDDRGDCGHDDEAIRLGTCVAVLIRVSNTATAITSINTALQIPAKSPTRT